MRWPGESRRRVQPVRGCGNWILRCAFPISERSSARIGELKIASDMRRLCAEPGCQNDGRIAAPGSFGPLGEVTNDEEIVRPMRLWRRQLRLRRQSRPDVQLSL